MSVRIDRCYCFGQTFAKLREVAEATGADSVEALQEHALFGRQCRLCHPYVRRMLRTGETVFGHVITEADEPAVCASGGGAPPPHGAPPAGQCQP